MMRPLFRFFFMIVIAQAFVLEVPAQALSVNRAGDLIYTSGFETEAEVILDLNSRTPTPDASISAGRAYVPSIAFTTAVPRERLNARLMVDGRDISADCYTSANRLGCLEQAFSAGVHQVEVTVGGARSSWSFTAIEPPKVEYSSPSGVLPFGAMPLIEARFSDANSNIDVGAIRLTFNNQDVTGQASITMATPRNGTVSFTPSAALSPGDYDASLALANQLGAESTNLIFFSVAPAVQYRAEFISPDEGTVVLNPLVRVVLEVTSNVTEAQRVQIDGVDADVESYVEPRRYYRDLELRPGLNQVRAVVMFKDGTQRTFTRAISFDDVPIVSIEEPRDFSILGALGANQPGGASNLTGQVERPVTIVGSVSRPVEQVLINQQQATLDAARTGFRFERYFLREGTNLISATARDERGRSGTTNITLYVDQTAPLLNIEGPAANSITSAASIDVRGTVNDAVEGGQNAPEPSVSVRNLANSSTVNAQSTDRYFLALDVPLEVGDNPLQVSARDHLGNARTKEIHVTRIAVGSRRVTLVSGNRQSANIDQLLEQPLVVAAIDPEGLPIADLPIRFDVQRGTGSLQRSASQTTSNDGVNPARNLVVITDAYGNARVWLRAGKEGVIGGNMVVAHADSIAEEVMFTATTRKGAPAWVMVNGAAGSQFAQTNSQPLEALSALVLDEHNNRVAGTVVTFRIESGDAIFNAASAPGGVLNTTGSEIKVVADKNGLASVRPLLGDTPETVQIRATILAANNVEVSHALFQIIVLERRDGPTAFVGVVQDHTGAALAGVRLSISRTALTATTDGNGRFRFNDVPAGKIDLFVDGRTVNINRGGITQQFPALHFETAVIQGQTNQLPHAIYLPPVNLAQAQIVGGNQDVSLTIPGFEGFEMIVKAGSVTFPDGTHTGPLVISPVHNDRLPMVPPGAAGIFAAVGWTIQPTGTRFDPPITVKIPNTLAMKPGETAPIVQWDHDLASFVPMGLGTISEDGTQLVSDSGSGISKAGWGGGGPPPTPPNCGDNPPPTCRAGDGSCTGCAACKYRPPSDGTQCPVCQADPSQVAKSCMQNACKQCIGGNCERRFSETPPLKVTTVNFLPPIMKLAPMSASGLFSGFIGDNVNPEDWDFEIEPYCTPEGLWKFALTKAEIQSTITIQAPWGFTELTGSIIATPPIVIGIQQCDYLNRLEFTMKYTRSSHFAGGPESNPVLQCLRANGAGGLPGGTLYNNQAGTQAHEKLHFTRFQGYVNLNFGDFLTKIQQFSLPIASFPTLQAAKAEALRQRWPGDAVIIFNNRANAIKVMTGGPGDHTPESAFYNAGLGGIADILSRIQFQRLLSQCPPTIAVCGQ